jgi:acyl-ACP thioesterase
VAEGDAGRRFRGRRQVGAADVDAAGGAHAFAIARWLQEVAFADGLDAGIGAESVWVIRRLRLEVDRLPTFPEELELETWCSAKAKSLAERTTTIRGEGGAELTATAIWVHVDPETRMPARLPAAFEATYGPSAAGRRARGGLRHPPAAPADAARFDWWFGRSLIDLADHVSNLWYWQVAEEFLEMPRVDSSPVALEAEFRAGIGHGPAVVRRSDSMLWICAEDDTVAATIAAPAP